MQTQLYRIIGDTMKSKDLMVFLYMATKKINVLGGKMEKDIIILTCSAKHGGYCVAGIDTETGDWIRLVASDDLETNEIPKDFMFYSDYTVCKPLDVVSVQIIEYLPGDIQPENVLVDLECRPVFKGRVVPKDLDDYISNESYIYESTSSYMDESTARRCGHSLALYKVQNIYLMKFNDLYGFPKIKLRFTYNECIYDRWSMTDPDYYRCDEGKICDEGLIVVSIPEDDFKGKYYKFVSKIIRL